LTLIIYIILNGKFNPIYFIVFQTIFRIEEFGLVTSVLLIVSCKINGGKADDSTKSEASHGEETNYPETTTRGAGFSLELNERNTNTV
jgi:hypothetical protein